MKIKFLLSLLILVVSPTLFALVDESLFNDDSIFVQCILGAISPGTVQVISCNERDQCITNDDSML